MNKKQYQEQRKALMNEAENLMNAENLEESNAKMEEVKELDNRWEQSKVAAANLAALKGNNEAINLENKSVNLEGGKVLDNIQEVKNVLSDEKIYENAWAKSMMGKSLDDNEKVVFDKVNTEFSNAYTHDSTNTAILIPETVAAGIWARAEESYPLYADAKKFNVRGKLVIKKHVSIDAGDAAWYTESTPTADEQNTFGELVLDGFELAKAITVTWKLKAMAMSEFIPYIIKELGDRMGVALGVAAARGNGATQPRGVETALLAESGTPQVVTYDPEATTPVPLTYAKLTDAISRIHSSYLNGAVIYANNATIWNVLANMMDDNGRPLFVPDVTSGGVGRMFGFVVKPDAGVSPGNIIIGKASEGLIFNVNEPMSVATEEHVKARTTDYAAYAVVDGDVMDEKAFSLIRNIPGA